MNIKYIQLLAMLFFPPILAIFIYYWLYKGFRQWLSEKDEKVNVTKAA